MARGKKHSPEQVVNVLRQIEVSIANGKTTGLACKKASITEQTYYRWRREYGGLQVLLVQPRSLYGRKAVDHPTRLNVHRPGTLR